MSGIVGIVNLDGAPVDRELLERMTKFMSFRGPDAQGIWIDGHVGFGHTMLRTTEESLVEKQPSSLDGKVWITTDARMDGRADLIQKLESKGEENLKSAADPELVLHAYHAWGEDCVNHLLGDFAFAIWDGPRQRLFCARDHFGVKPFYYALIKNCLIFSNTLNCVRLHPLVSDKLNDLAIADFLLFDLNQNPATTTFADIQRLPPAHSLTCSKGGVRNQHRYWTLPTDDRIRYKEYKEYVEHFKELLRMAVSDRLRNNRVAIWMSGGLDSPTVAATAQELLSKQYSQFDVRAYTVIFDSLIPDKERYYSGMVAEKIGIVIRYHVADQYELYECFDQPELCRPEPMHDPLAVVWLDQLKQVAAENRVVLTGEGGDSSLYQSQLPGLIQGLGLGRLVMDLASLVLFQLKIPRLGYRTMLKDWLGITTSSGKPPYPIWLNDAFETRLHLRKRWDYLNNGIEQSHSIRPDAYKSLVRPYWQYLFEAYDPGVTFSLVELRHPFFDVRLLNYLLAIPPMPWFVNKHILRVAMRGVLPERVRLRPKAPLAGEPVMELLRNPKAGWVDNFSLRPELADYVNRDRIPTLSMKNDFVGIWMNLRPLSLNYWFRHSYRLRTSPNRGEQSYGERRKKTNQENL